MTSNLIQYPSGLITSIGTRVRLRLLPKGIRQATMYTITAVAPTAQSFTTAAATALGGTSLQLASVPVSLRAGTQLTFTGTTVTLLTQLTQSSTPQTVSIAPAPAAIAAAATAAYTPAANAIGSTMITVAPTPTVIDAGEILGFGSNLVTVSNQAPAGARLLLTTPLSAAVSAAATAQTQALLALVGCTDASPSSAPKTTDAATYLSGAGSEMVTIGTNRTLKLAYNEIEGDLGGLVLKSMLFDDRFATREVYARVDRPNGEVYEGAAILTNGDGQGPVQEKVTRSADMQFQGASFSYTPPTADIANVAALMV